MKAIRQALKEPKAEKTKPSKPAKQPRPAKPAKEPKPKRVSGLDAAATIVGQAKTPLTAKEILERITEQKLWSSPKGKTPDATLSAAMTREIAAKGKASRFVKTGPGLFAAA